MCKGQVWKPLLNVRDHRALRRYCLRNCHAIMMDIATWARGYFGKTLSLNTICRCIKKCNLKLYYAKEEGIYSFCAETSLFSWARSHLRWTENSGNMFSGQTSPHFSLFLGKKEVGFYVPKMKKTIQTVTNEKCKKQPL